MLRRFHRARRANSNNKTRHGHDLHEHAPHGSHDGHEADCAALCCARRGQSATVLRFAGEGERGEGESGEAARLREMGVREGAVVTVLRDGDPLMVRVGGARFGIGRRAAMRVLCDILD